MELGDRIFWGVILFVFICLFWLKYLERHMSIWVGAGIGAVALIAVVLRAGPGKGGARSKGGGLR